MRSRGYIQHTRFPYSYLVSRHATPVRARQDGDKYEQLCGGHPFLHKFFPAQLQFLRGPIDSTVRLMERPSDVVFYDQSPDDCCKGVRVYVVRIPAGSCGRQGFSFSSCVIASRNEMEPTEEPLGPPPPTAPPPEVERRTPSVPLQLTPLVPAKVAPGEDGAGPTDPGSSASTARAPPSVSAAPPPVPETAEARRAPTCFPGTGGRGPRQTPVFDHAGDVLVVPQGSSLWLSGNSLGAGAPREMPSASLGLSDVVQTVAYDPALRLLLCGDQNGLASRLVALDAASLALRWTTPAGALNSCCGLAVLPQQSLVVAASLGELHVRRCGSGEGVSTLAGVNGPTFLAADAATATVFASTVRRPAGAGAGGAATPLQQQQHVVSAYQWDAAGGALVLLGEVREAGAAAAPRPLTVIRATTAAAHLVVGTCGSSELLVLALPSCKAVHRFSVPPTAAASADGLQAAAPAISGCAADPTGAFIAVIDAAAGGATHVLAWPPPGFPAPPPPPPLDAGGRGADAAFVCLCCRQRVPGRPAGVCARCAPPPPAGALKGWLCEACHLQHAPRGRLARHAGAVRAVAPGLRAPALISPAPLAEGGPEGSAPLQQSLQLQACISPSPAPVLFLPRGVGVELFDGAGAPLPRLSAAALGLAAGAVACCAFDRGSGTLLVSDGARVAAVDVDTRAVRWSAAAPGCIGLCVLHRGASGVSGWWGPS